MGDTVENKNDLLAISIVLLGNICWVLAFIYPNENQIKSYQSGLVRGFALIIAGYIICVKQNLPITFENPFIFKNLFVRNSIMTAFGWVIALSQFYLPLPIVHTISGAGPIFIFIIDYYINGIKINKKQLIGIVIGVLGLVLTVNGRIIMTYFDPTFSIDSEFQNYRTENIILIFFVALVLVAINALWAYGIVLTKALVGINPIQIVFHLGILMTMMSAVFYCMVGQYDFTWIKLIKTFFLTGIPSTITTICYISAVKMSKNTGILMIVNFSMVVMGYLMSILYYKERQNIVCALGVVLIVVGVIKAILFKTN